MCVRELSSEYSFVKQWLEGQGPDRYQCFGQVNARYEFLRGQPREIALVAREKAVNKDPDKVCYFTCHKIGHISRAYPSRKSAVNIRVPSQRNILWRTHLRKVRNPSLNTQMLPLPLEMK